ncbi:MAG: hypothetical protein IKI77_06370 [Oscillospiraceae bacterium]|nr:hypothetical protein [Oscillospiraceae bacterium]
MSMLTMKFNADEMMNVLEEQLMFPDETVTAGVYCTFQDTGFFASSRHIVTGYAGLTSRGRLIGLRCGMIRSEPFSVDLNYLTKLKLRKTLFGMRSVYLEYFAERRIRLKFTVSPRILGSKFPDQYANTEIIMQQLSAYQR